MAGVAPLRPQDVQALVELATELMTAIQDEVQTASMKAADDMFAADGLSITAAEREVLGAGINLGIGNTLVALQKRGLISVSEASI